jgi:hypothetical protein
VQEAGSQRLVAVLALGLTRGGEGAHGIAVVGPVARHELPPARLAVLLVVLARDLKGRLVGLRAAVGVENDVLVVEPLVELLAQHHGGLVAHRERVVGQLDELVVGSLCQLFAAVADVDAPEAGHAVEVTVAFRVGDPSPTALRHYYPWGRCGASPLDRRVARQGVPDVALVLLNQLADPRVLRVHAGPSYLKSFWGSV